MACGSGKVTIQLVDEEAGPGAQDPKLFRGQSYEAIQAACLDEGILFRDPYFPAGPDALGYDQLGPDSEKAKGVKWMRPHEFCAEPQFICEDMSRTDVCQGRLGNCWFLAAAASLTLHPRLLHRVVPPEQGFRENYAGVFHFQLWQFGCWVDVVVDDRLPVREGKLMFVRSEQRNEFWAPLLEKAYAKLHGSYEVMRGGHMNEAFVDFTGGVGEVIYLRQDTPGLFSALRHALAKESLVGATALSNQGEYRTEDGLVKGHAYSVTGTHKMSLGFTKVRLLRLRNPWGRVEWTGPWSDSCPRWDVLPPEWRDALLVRKEDGEFWMELQDFLRHFNTVQICSLSPEVLGPRPAGGGWALLEPDEEDEEDEDGPWGCWAAAGARGPARGGRVPKCTVLLSLIQRNRRCLRAQGLTYLTVGFHVFQVGALGRREAGLRGCPRSQAGLGGWGSRRSVIRREIDDVISADLHALRAPNIPLDLGLKLLFQELAGEEEELSAPQLQTLLSIALEPARAHSWTTGEIGLRTCEQLLQCFGHGRSLALHDFQQVWGHLREWQAIFDKFDQDTSGTMNSHELRLALNAAGFHLNNQLTQALTSRYRDSRLRVDLERFVSCVAQLTCIFCRCSQHLDGGEGVICLTRQQWTEMAHFS
ncbi:PREDICTED: calpain-12 [Myotis davidii]|uniref:calpain-12 n=1 Tax=Myotis davidii TaxID=225400 RepID=UPI000766E887|nr:PREDICTED: calpain-12 [Myotis davidii]